MIVDYSWIPTPTRITGRPDPDTGNHGWKDPYPYPEDEPRPAKKPKIHTGGHKPVFALYQDGTVKQVMIAALSDEYGIDRHLLARRVKSGKPVGVRGCPVVKLWR